jgi:hypothetical protein
MVVDDNDTSAAVPVPLSETTCVPMESVTVTVPLRIPAAVGVNVTPNVQFALAATVAHVLLAIEKSPEAVTLLMVSASVPVLLRVTVCAALLVPTA